MKKQLSPLLKFTSLLVVMVVLVFASGCARPGSQSAAVQTLLTIKGSDTLVHLVSGWAEGFMKTHPGLQVSVTGGGSGTGIAALLNGTTDLAASSRDLHEGEKKLASQKGLVLEEIVIGRDALTIIINPANPVDELTMAQLKDIYTGKITNWRELGGPDQPVLVYSRESSSGTYAFFQEHVLEKQDFAKSTRLMPATSGIVEAVASDKAGIGYVGMAYALEAKDKLKFLGIKANDASPAVLPSEKTVLNGTYPIARPLYLFVPEAATGLVEQFVDYALSDEGQQIVTETGYIPNPKL